MGLNIEELIKLDRLRDEKVEGTGIKRTVEICRNPEKVLKETEEYIYEKVEVVDGAFIKNRGIVDEIVRMTFHDETYERSLNNHYRKNKSTVELYGFYLRYRKTTESHPFDLLFRKCEKAYINRFKRSDGKRSSELCFEEDHRSQARLLVFEILCGANKKFNDSFRKKFNLDITNISDFKIMLLDKKLAEEVQKYITKTVSVEATKIAYRGRNQDYIYGQKKKNGVAEKYSKQIKSFYLDKASQDNEKSDGYSFIKIEDGVYEDEIVDKAFILEDEIQELKEQDNLYKYILENIEKIVTKKQLLYLKAYLNNDDEAYLSTIGAANKSKDGLHATRTYYKSKIRDYIEKYLDKDLYVTKSNNKFEFKESVLVALENILKKSTKRDIFIELCDYLKKENNTVLENILIDSIYSLDVKCYHPIVNYLNNNTIDNNYIENEFNTVIEELQKAYNWYGKNNNTIYNLNRNNKELQVENILKKVLDNNKEGYVSRSSKSDNFISIRELKEMIQNVEGIKLTNKTLKEVLNKYGYDINLAATKKNYEEVYNVFVLGHEVKKKDTYKKKKRTFDLTLKQSKDIEKFIDTNLKLDKLLRTNKDIDGHLRLCDIRSFIENTLNVKQLSVDEIYEILIQCNYNLDLKSGSKQINGVKVHAHKIEKIE